MNPRMRIALSISLILMIFACPCLANDKKTAQDVLDRAIEMVDKKGPDYTLKVINALGPFTEGEIYVFAVTMDGVCVAHPYSKKLIGRDLSDLKDIKGKPFIREFQQVAATSGSGWVDYWWKNPMDKEPRLKRTLIRKIDGENMYIGAGYYLSQDEIEQKLAETRAPAE